MIPKERNPIIKKMHHTNSLLTDFRTYAARCEYVGKKSYRYFHLKLFKNEMQGQKTEESYRRQSWRILFYRTIFYTFTFLFFGLTIFTLSNSIAISTALFGSFEILPKVVVCALCTLLAAASFAIATSLCVAKELTNELADGTKKQILHVFSCQPPPFEGVVSSSEYYNKKFKQVYKSAIHAIEQKKNETLFLLREIQRAKNLGTEEKRILFCHALDEMEEEFKALIENTKYTIFLTI